MTYLRSLASLFMVFGLFCMIVTYLLTGIWIIMMSGVNLIWFILFVPFVLSMPFAGKVFDRVLNFL